MMIENPCVVTLTWTLTDAQNRPIDELREPCEFFFGGQDLLPGIEAALQGQTTGFEAQLQLEPEQAFGDYDPAMVCFEARSLFPPTLELGMQFDGLPVGAVTPDMPAEALYNVTEIFPEHVVLDGNHPLAGMALRIHIKVLDLRAATPEECEAGSVGGGLFTVAASAESGRLGSAQEPAALTAPVPPTAHHDARTAPEVQGLGSTGNTSSNMPG